MPRERTGISRDAKESHSYSGGRVLLALGAGALADQMDCAVDGAHGDFAAASAELGAKRAEVRRRRSRADGKLRRKITVHRLHVQVRARVGRQCENDRAVDGLDVHRRAVCDVAQLKRKIAIRRLGVEAAGAVSNLDVAIDRTQIASTLHAVNEDTAVDRLHRSEKDAERNVDVVFNGDTISRAAGVERMNGDLPRVAFNVDLDAVEIAGIVLGRLHGADFDFVPVPAFNLDRAVDIVELKIATGGKRISLVKKLIGSGEARQSENERGRQKRAPAGNEQS